jgi:hypothetical protein
MNLQRGEMDGWIKVGMVFGANRLRGTTQGAMYASDEFGGEDYASVMRGVLLEEADDLGLEIDEAWINEQLMRLLKMYEDKFVDWRERRQETVGFVYEMGLPSGKKLLMGEPMVLQRVNRVH